MFSIPIWFDLKNHDEHGGNYAFYFFNSYMVRFKDGIEIQLNGLRPFFNSYMVRFKVMM